MHIHFFHHDFGQLHNIYPLVISGYVKIAMENHHAIHGKIHELSMAIFNSELLVYQRVYIYIYFPRMICIYIIVVRCPFFQG